MTLDSETKNLKIKIEELLNEHRTAKGVVDFTHVSMGGITFPGKFNFTDSKKRYKLAKYLARACDLNLNFSIAEKLKKYGPILVDLDFRSPKDINNNNIRLYDMDMINHIISKYRKAIIKYLTITEEESTCFVFEKEQAREKNGEAADGVHLIFPYLVVSDKVRHLIFKNVNTECIEEELFTKYCNASSVIDNKVISTNPWLMYGCCKSSSIPYKLTQIKDSMNNNIDVSTIGTTEDIIRLISLRDSRWNDTNATPYNENINETTVEGMYNEFASDIDNTMNDMLDDIIPGDKLELVEKCIKLTEMLSDKRAQGFHDWIRVGWSLHNTHKCLLDTFILFSKKSNKYQNGECERLWKNMKDDGYTIRSLMLWAKEDNIEEYKKFIKEDFENNLKKNSVNNTFMIAKALYCKYFDKFVCANPKDNIWYYFSEHRWRKCSGGGKLITLISSEFANHYIDMATQFDQKAMKASESEKKTFLDQAAHFHKIASVLMDISYKEKLLKEARYLFHDENFIRRLDENYHLIGFENGVYDLNLKMFRKGHPDDHISMCTNNHYTKWNKNNPYAHPIKDFFEKILPNKDVRNYFLSRLSTCVSGENREEKFYFCTGSGSNGKSLVFQLANEALGDYAISCPITIITRKRGASNAASPELARMKGPRMGVYQEPGNDEELNVGIFKELSGNDKFMVRGLYQEPIEVKPQLKHWMTMNEKPIINSDDGGTWRRLRVIDFNSKFVENPDPLNPNEFMLDDTLKGKISQWSAAFASYLIHVYITMYDVPNKVPEPLEVQMSTNKYRKDQDLVREYYDTSLEITLLKTDTIKKKDLYAHFRLWFRELHEGETLPKSKKLYDFMEKEIKHKYGNNGWPFIKFKKEYPKTDEIEEDTTELVVKKKEVIQKSDLDI